MCIPEELNVLLTCGGLRHLLGVQSRKLNNGTLKMYKKKKFRGGDFNS